MDRNSVPAVLVAAIIIILVASFIQIPAGFSEPITVTADEMAFQAAAQPTVLQGRSVAPFTSIFEALGVDLRWHEKTVETMKIPTDTVLDSQLKSEIVQAYLFAYSLEEQLWGQAEEFRSKDAVFQFMQQGFFDAFAQELADYYWTEPEGLLGLGAYLIVPEHTIYVLEIDMVDNEASLWHETDQWERDHWSMDDYKIVTLQQEGSVWKVKDEHSVETPPANIVI